MIYIIGAGPIGCFLAENLAKAGKKVILFEEHGEIGKPLHCTGHLTEAIKEFFSVPELEKNKIIVNTINGIKVISPDGKYVEIPSKELVIDRARFDRYLAQRAMKAGVSISIKTRLIEIKNDGKRNILVLKAGKKISRIALNPDDIVIGADGPNSIVRRLINEKKDIKNRGDKNHKYYTGIQARVIFEKKIDPKEYVTFFGKDIAPGFFAWLVPENSRIARVGLAVPTDKSFTGKSTKINSPSSYFRRFLDKIKQDYGPIRIVETYGGLIPIYSQSMGIHKKLGNNHLFVIGDAASQLKATTGGGLIPGLRASKRLFKAIMNNDCSCYKGFDKELAMHKVMRSALDRFSDKDYDNLIKKIDSDAVKRILRRYNRDEALKLGFLIALKRPSIIALGIKAFIKERY